MFLGFERDTKRCGSVWSRVVQICGVLSGLSFQLLATPQGACSAKKRPAKDAPKIALQLSSPRGRTWTHVDAHGPHVINFSHLLLLQHNITSQGTQWLTLGLSQNSEQWWQGFCSENDFLSNAENLSSTYAFTFTSYHVYRRSHLHYITYVCVNIHNILTLDELRQMQTFKGNSIKEPPTPSEKPLGDGVSTPMPIFCLICTIISNKTCILD